MSQTDSPTEESATDATTQQHVEGPPPTKRLTKRRDGQVIDGVCSGIGAYLGIDPVLVRLGFVAAVFAGGAGVVGYIACMILVPDDPGDGAPARVSGSERSPQLWVGAGLIVLAVAILAARFDLFDGGVFWPLVLIGIGVALWRTSDGDGGDQTVDAPGATSSDASSGPPGTPVTPAGPVTNRESEPQASRGHRAPRGERSAVGRVTVAVALVVSGILVGVDSAGAMAVSVSEILAVALVVVGGGLLFASRWGRSRGLLPVGIVLALAVAASGYAERLEVPLAAGIGERIERPGSVAELEEDYALSVGHLVVDLGDLDLDGDTVATDVDLGLGQVEVLVPDDVDVVVDASAGTGQLELFGAEYSGGVGIDRRFEEAGDGGGTLELEVSTGIGQVVVERDSEFDASWNADVSTSFESTGVADRHSTTAHTIESSR